MTTSAISQLPRSISSKRLSRPEKQKLTTMVVNFCFSGRDKRLLLIDLGNWLIVLVLTGAVIGWLGV